MPGSSLCVINVVGLSFRHLTSGAFPRLAALAEEGELSPLQGIMPAVTCPAQATMLTGVPPARHGIVGNGWFVKELGEIRFWVQANAMVQAEPVYVTDSRTGSGAWDALHLCKIVLVV